MDGPSAALDVPGRDVKRPAPANSATSEPATPPRGSPPLDQETLRTIAWEIGERRPADLHNPRESYIGLAMVHPTLGFAYFRMLHDWVQEIAAARADQWDGSRPVLRLYDTSYIQFNGFNAHRIQDEPLHGLSGEFFFNLPRPGTWQIAEVGFLLRNGEFIPAARSPAVAFAPDSPSRHGGSQSLLVTRPGKVEHVGNVWDADRELADRRRPRLRHPLRIASMAFASRPTGQNGPLADFVTELAMGQRSLGHDVHVFLPATESFRSSIEDEGVHYPPLTGIKGRTPLEQARSFAERAEKVLADLPPFDLVHLHEWMTGMGTWYHHRPTVLSLGSIEATRRSGREADATSREIERLEKEIGRRAGIVLTPNGLREQAVAELGLEPGRVHGFPMEGRLPNEWEAPLDFGHVKMEKGLGPLDRLMIFVGPLEHAAGVDLLLEALNVLLRRWENLRLVYVGNGPMRGQLEGRAHELGVAHAVRFLGDVGGSSLIRILRASEALVLPSRHRIAMDDAVVDLARKASRPVITTHGGPAHLVRHEENGLLTYDNPGSMVWAMDRVLGDPAHAERMGQHARREDGGTPRWCDVAQHYLQGCVEWFPELTQTRM